MNFHTRRGFIRTTFLGGATVLTVPAFLERTFGAMDLAAAASASTPTGRDHPILVILQLAGGNDGLNTVIPHADDAYYSARPKLAVPAKTVLKVDGAFGLHPKLAGLRGLLDEGCAAVVHGVGYPNPNRSHFRSTDIWQTASDAEKIERHGWVGRYFDACCKGEDPIAGIAIGRSEPLAFSSSHPRGIAFNDPGKLRFDAGGASDPGAMDAAFREMADEDGGGAQIAMLPGAASTGEDSPADFLRRAALDAQMGSDKIREVTAKFKTSAPFPKSGIGRSLELVSRLIAGSMPTRVYYVSQGGYDTHSGQAGTHERLLGELDAGLTAFAAEMKAQKNFDRVALLTFSEFGRRVAENASGGTDHGAAAPLFLVGGKIAPGLHGTPPSLTKLDAGDLVHTCDFRSVYATVLDRWLGAPSESILGRKFPHVMADGRPLIG